MLSSPHLTCDQGGTEPSSRWNCWLDVFFIRKLDWGRGPSCWIRTSPLPVTLTRRGGQQFFCGIIRLTVFLVETLTSDVTESFTQLWSHVNLDPFRPQPGLYQSAATWTTESSAGARLTDSNLSCCVFLGRRCVGVNKPVTFTCSNYMYMLI